MILFVAFLAFSCVFLYLDRASVPAYQCRNAYRWVAFLLLALLMWTAYKAESYRQELRYQIQVCR